MYTPAPDIRTPRLVLRRLSAAFLEAALDGRTTADLEAMLGMRLPDGWLANAGLFRLRLGGLLADPAYADWSLRAVGLAATGGMVGHAGFHAPPGAPYLAGLAPGAVELGYTIYAPFRRRGYGREATAGLIRWAHDAHGVRRFVASVGPGNAASRSLLGGLGFVRVGGHEDDVDGYEDVMLLEDEPLSKVLSASALRGPAADDLPPP